MRTGAAGKERTGAVWARDRGVGGGDGGVRLAWRYRAWRWARLLLVRFLMGVLTTPLFPAAGRIVHAWIPFGSRAWANGLVLGATTIGVAAAPIGFGGLSDRLGWRQASMILGALTALLTGLWAVHGRNSPAEHRGVNEAERKLIGTAPATAVRAGGNFGGMLTNPDLLLLTCTYAVVGYYEYALFYWMKYYFSDVLGYPEQTSR